MNLLDHSLERALETAAGETVNRFEIGRPSDFACADVPIPGPHAACLQSELEVFLSLVQHGFPLLVPKLCLGTHGCEALLRGKTNPYPPSCRLRLSTLLLSRKRHQTASQRFGYGGTFGS